MVQGWPKFGNPFKRGRGRRKDRSPPRSSSRGRTPSTPPPLPPPSYPPPRRNSYRGNAGTAEGMAQQHQDAIDMLRAHGVFDQKKGWFGNSGGRSGRRNSGSRRSVKSFGSAISCCTNPDGDEEEEDAAPVLTREEGLARIGDQIGSILADYAEGAPEDEEPGDQVMQLLAKHWYNELIAFLDGERGDISERFTNFDRESFEEPAADADDAPSRGFVDVECMLLERADWLQKACETEERDLKGELMKELAEVEKSMFAKYGVERPDDSATEEESAAEESGAEEESAAEE